VFTIQIPPLRDRKEDIPLLTENFIRKTGKREKKSIKGMAPGAMKRLIAHTWPGNVRELENAIEHAFVVCAADYISETDLPAEIQNAAGTRKPLSAPAPSPEPATQNLTRETLMELLDQCHWNKAEVGRRIGKSRTLVWKLMKKWDIPLQKEDIRPFQ
jgi:DNA-binding NtrC family response regulator